MAYAEIEDRQLGNERWRVMINRDGQRTLYESYATQAGAEAGLILAKAYLADKDESLRDRFAMAAISTFLGKIGSNDPLWASYSLSDAAADAYGAADAMLAAREVKS